MSFISPIHESERVPEGTNMKNSLQVAFQKSIGINKGYSKRQKKEVEIERPPTEEEIALKLLGQHHSELKA